MKQIATAKTIPSFRAGGRGGRLSTVQSDRSRRWAGYAQQLHQEQRRQWLNRAWYTEFHHSNREP